MVDSALADISSAIHVRHIMTPVGRASPFTRFDSVEEVRDHLARNRFDAAPVFPVDSKRQPGRSPGNPDGIVRRDDLDGLVPSELIGIAVQSLRSETLIGGQATLTALLGRFREKQTFLLVVGSSAIEGLVTPSDLNKQAGRTHLFMRVSALELALADIVRKRSKSDEDLLASVDEERARALKSRYAKKASLDEAADLVAAFDLKDLLRVCRVGLLPEPPFAQLTDDQIKQLSDFRNDVMHAVLKPSGDGDVKLSRLLEQDSLITGLVDCAEAASGNRPAEPEIAALPQPTSARQGY